VNGTSNLFKDFKALVVDIVGVAGSIPAAPTIHRPSNNAPLGRFLIPGLSGLRFHRPGADFPAPIPALGR
jgi:hypothetical protein